MQQFKHLLVGIDFSARSGTAAEMAVSLARPMGATVELTHVVESLPTEIEAGVLGLEKSHMEATIFDEVRLELSRLAEQLGYRRLQIWVTSGRAAEQLTKRAEEEEFGLLVVGDTGAMSTERGNGLGTTAHRLIERGPRYVLVVKPRYHGKLDKVVAAVDFSPVSDEVLDRAAAIARASRSELFVVHVYSTMYIQRLRHVYDQKLIARGISEIEDYSRKQLAGFLRARQTVNVTPKPVVLPGSPGAALTTYSQDEQIDLVVLGTGTSPRIAGFAIGSTTHTVASDSPASILVVRSQE